MKIHENVGKSHKNYKPRGWIEVRSILHSYGLSNSCQIVQWDPLNAKRSSLQNNLSMGYVKGMVSMATPYMILENMGVGLQIQSYLGFYSS